MTVTPPDNLPAAARAVPKHLHGSRAALFHLLRQTAETKAADPAAAARPKTAPKLFSKQAEPPPAAPKAARAGKRLRPAAASARPAAPSVRSGAAPPPAPPPAAPRLASWACLGEEDCFHFRSGAARAPR